MSTRNVYLGLIALIVSCTLGAPHDENNNQTSTPNDQLPPIRSSTTTFTFTGTTTTTLPYVPPRETGNYTSGFATPPPPGSVTAPSDGPDYSKSTSTAVTLICPHPTEPCIIDGIPIWPSGTTSLVLPSFTYDPLPTSMASGSLPSAGSTMVTDTLATSASPTIPISRSTTFSHNMSHTVPESSSSDISWVPELPWITRWETLSTPSGSLPTFSVLSSTVPEISAAGLPIPVVSGSKTSEFYWPTRSTVDPSSSATSSITSIGEGSTASISSSNASTSASTTAIPSTSYAISAHPRCKAKSTQSSDAKALMNARDIETKTSNITNSSVLTLKTKHIDASLFRGMENAIPSAGRDEESKATKRRTNYWTRFFAVADPLAPGAMGQCLACDPEGEVTCLPGGKYTWCTDGCAVTLNLGCDMVCKEGVIRKEGKHCVR